MNLSYLCYLRIFLQSSLVKAERWRVLDLQIRDLSTLKHEGSLGEKFFRALHAEEVGDLISTFFSIFFSLWRI